MKTLIIQAIVTSDRTVTREEVEKKLQEIKAIDLISNIVVEEEEE